MLLGQYFLIMRSSMVDVLTEDFVTVKRATGLPWHRVVRSHAVPERAAAAGDAVGDPVRGGRRRRDHDRDDLLLARARRAELPGDQRQGLPGARGHVPGLLRRGDPRQPARRLPLLLPRPAGAVDDEPGAGSRRDPDPRRASAPRSRPRTSGVRDAAARAPGAGASGSASLGAVHLHRDLRQRARARTTRTPRASTCWRRRAATTSWARPRTAPTSSRRSSSARGSRSSSASPRRSSRRCSARPSASPAATSAAGPTASSTRSRTGSW